MRIVFVSLILLFQVIQLVGQEDQNIESNSLRKSSSELNKEIKAQLLVFDDYQEFDSLIDNHIDQAIQYYKKLPEDGLTVEQRLFTINRIAVSYWYAGEYSVYKDYVDQGLRLIESSGCISSYPSGKIYSLMGIHLYYVMHKADSALFYLERAHEIFSNALIADDKLMVDSYLSIGDIYCFYKYDYDQARKYYQMALDLLVEEDSSQLQNRIRCYYGLGIACRISNDYNSGLSYLKKAISEITQMVEGRDKDQLNDLCCMALGDICMDKENFEMALNYYSLVSKGSGNQGEILCNKSVCYLYMERLEDAMLSSQGALKVLDPDAPRDLEFIADCHTVLGKCFAKLEDVENALVHFETALEFWDLIDPQNSKKSDIYNDIGLLSMDSKDYSSALESYQKSIIFNCEGFDDLNPFANPAKEQISVPIYLINTLLNKAICLKTIYNQSGDEEYLFNSQECLKLSDYLIEKSMKSFLVEESKLLLGEQVDPVYLMAVKNAYDLYQLYPGNDYLNDALHFFERNRYKFLLESLKDIKAYNNSDVPDSIVRKLKYYEAKRASFMSNSNSLDSFWNDSADIFTLKIASLNTQLEKFYPEFFLEKEKLTRININIIQDSLQVKDRALIQYFYGSEEIFVLTSFPTKTTISKIIIDSTFTYFLNEFEKYLESYESGYEGYSSFVESSVYLYEKLVKNHVDSALFDNIGEIIFIPDGELNRINFEALVTNTPTTVEVDYKDLDYLIKRHIVTYAFSSSIMFLESEKEKTPGKSKILGFSFGTSEGRRGFNNLKGSNQELKSISNKISGNYYSNDKATKEVFVNQAGDFKILHLALHGMADRDMGDSTYLVFRNPQILNGYEKLFFYELYGLNLNADLIFLSSCSSGSGKLYKGEGIYSMARAFFYSGGSSIISSLWPLNDQVANKLISDFYDRLLRVGKIGLALRESKLSYIEQVAHQQQAHPHYWASIICQGNQEEIKIYPNYFRKYGLLLIICLIILLLLIRKKLYQVPQ